MESGTVSRQRCKLCDRPEKFNFHVPDDIWSRVVPTALTGSVICLFCFDALAEVRGVEYAKSLDELWFAGDKAVFGFSVKERVAL